MKNIGVIGLGVMGAPMAVNLARAGYQVTGHTRSERGKDQLRAAGGRIAADPAEVAVESDVVITMLPDSPDVESVLTGRDGVLAAARSGALLIDCSTISPPVASRLAMEAQAAGHDLLDAPVSGGEKGAREATLSIMVGGDRAAFDRARPVLSAVGATIVHVGPAGSGQAVKAANQLVVAGNIALVAEAMVLLESLGVDLERALEVLRGGLAGSRVLDVKGEAMLHGEFSPGFRIDLHHKDLGIALSAAREAGAPLPVTGLVAQLVAAARALGHGGLDHGALLLVARQLAGRD